MLGPAAAACGAGISDPMDNGQQEVVGFFRAEVVSVWANDCQENREASVHVSSQLFSNTHGDLDSAEIVSPRVLADASKQVGFGVTGGGVR